MHLIKEARGKDVREKSILKRFLYKAVPAEKDVCTPLDVLTLCACEPCLFPRFYFRSV